MGEEGVLDLDLRGEEVREETEDGGEEAGECVAEIFVRGRVGVCGEGEVVFGFEEGGVLTVGAFGFLH